MGSPAMLIWFVYNLYRSPWLQGPDDKGLCHLGVTKEKMMTLALTPVEVNRAPYTSFNLGQHHNYTCYLSVALFLLDTSYVIQTTTKNIIKVR